MILLPFIRATPPPPLEPLRILGERRFVAGFEIGSKSNVDASDLSFAASRRAVVFMAPPLDGQPSYPLASLGLASRQQCWSGTMDIVSQVSKTNTS